MANKTIEVTIPDYITIDQYKRMSETEDMSALNKMVVGISAITGKTVDEVRTWPLDDIKALSKEFADLADHGQEFHSLIEWNGTLYGYAQVKQSSLGEYIDIENLCQDFPNNMHKIAAILYRPVKAHRFNSLEFHVKQKLKMVKNKVENVFDWYTLDTYDNIKRKQIEEEFKDFPAHIFLGAVSFFLNSVNLYSINTLYSEGQISLRMKNQMISQTLEHLSLTTGAGGGLSTTSLSPTFYQLQGIGQSPT